MPHFVSSQRWQEIFAYNVKIKKKIQHAVKSALAANRLTLSEATEASNNDTNRRLLQIHC